MGRLIMTLGKEDKRQRHEDPDIVEKGGIVLVRDAQAFGRNISASSDNTMASDFLQTFCSTVGNPHRAGGDWYDQNDSHNVHNVDPRLLKETKQSGSRFSNMITKWRQRKMR